MTVLVTGGAGYIGGHVVASLHGAGREAVVADDFSTGLRSRVPADVDTLEIDLASRGAAAVLAEFCLRNGVDSVLHLAARKRVDESVRRPIWYSRQNLGALENVLDAASAARIRDVVFSSSAAVYGAAGEATIAEDTPPFPINPYGQTKLAGEWLAEAWARAGGGRVISLRYFNVAGTADARMADRYALNLIPMVIDRVRAGEAPRVFGGDHPTPDGSCVRDFVHVSDLVDAHLLALESLSAAPAGSGEVFNLGTGRGSSVLEVIALVQRVAETQLTPVIEERRPGDPARVVASVERIRERLGWSSRLDLTEMVRSTWTARER